MVIGPAEVLMTATGLPGAGCSGAAGAGFCRSKPRTAKRIGIRSDRQWTPAASGHTVFGSDQGTQKIGRGDSSEWIVPDQRTFDVRGDEARPSTMGALQ